MLSKPYLIGIVGILVLASALGLLYFSIDEEGLPLPVETSEPESSMAAQATKSTAQSMGMRSGSAATEAPESMVVEPEANEPSFDVVRVDPEGNTVIAGKAQPNASVRIMDGARMVGEVQADENGEWVFLPDQKLPPGNSVLTLESDNGKEAETATKSENAVVVVIPEKGRDIAGRESSAAAVGNGRWQWLRHRRNQASTASVVAVPEKTKDIAGQALWSSRAIRLPVRRGFAGSCAEA